MSDGSQSMPSPVTIAKDLEGVAETSSTTTKSQNEMPSTTPQPAAGAAGGKPNPRQRKIAVLTSGGDSAGMNAAGE